MTSSKVNDLTDSYNKYIKSVKVKRQIQMAWYKKIFELECKSEYGLYEFVITKKNIMIRYKNI